MNHKIGNNIKIPPLFLGTYKHKKYTILKEIVEIGLRHGIVGFDSAPSYNTEKLLGKIIRENLNVSAINRSNLFISTKIDPWQMQSSNKSIDYYVDQAIKNLGIDYLDQLLIHWPIPDSFENTWDSFVKIYETGKVKVIGVCNVRRRHLLDLMDIGIPPMVVQNERHPLRTDEDTLKFCQDNQITYEAYSPVGQMNIQLQNSKTLNNLALKYNKSLGQIIMRWHIETGSVPVFMTTKPSRIKEYTEISNFSLADEDVKSISSLNKDYKIFLESISCPGF